jgi:hypothetical protein
MIVVAFRQIDIEILIDAECGAVMGLKFKPAFSGINRIQQSQA